MAISDLLKACEKYKVDCNVDPVFIVMDDVSDDMANAILYLQKMHIQDEDAQNDSDGQEKWCIVVKVDDKWHFFVPADKPDPHLILANQISEYYAYMDREQYYQVSDKINQAVEIVANDLQSRIRRWQMRNRKQP